MLSKHAENKQTVCEALEQGCRVCSIPGALDIQGILEFLNLIEVMSGMQLAAEVQDQLVLRSTASRV